MDYWNQGDGFDAKREPMPDISSILFLVMASKGLADRAEAVELGWLHEAPHRVYLTDGYLETIPAEKQWQPPETVIDESDDELVLEKECSQGDVFCVNPEYEWPADDSNATETRRELNRKEKEYAGAQRRQLLYLKAHPELPPGVEWVILLDDDTWVNHKLLRKALRGRNPDEPVMFAHVLSDQSVEENSNFENEQKRVQIMLFHENNYVYPKIKYSFFTRNNFQKNFLSKNIFLHSKQFPKAHFVQKSFSSLEINSKNCIRLETMITDAVARVWFYHEQHIKQSCLKSLRPNVRF